MIAFSKIFFATISFSIFYYVAFGQESDKIIIGHSLTVFQIDSICRSIDQNKNLVEGIAEGGFVNQKGGWETYDLKNNKMDTLFRIRDNSSADISQKTTFYYFNKKLIKAIIEIEDWNSGNTMRHVYSAIYYFNDDKPIKVRNEIFKYSNATEVLKQGQNYQNNFYNNH